LQAYLPTADPANQGVTRLKALSRLPT
jgi:hypothetical protein